MCNVCALITRVRCLHACSTRVIDCSPMAMCAAPTRFTASTRSFPGPLFVACALSSFLLTTRALRARKHCTRITGVQLLHACYGRAIITRVLRACNYCTRVIKTQESLLSRWSITSLEINCVFEAPLRAMPFFVEHKTSWLLYAIK